MINNKIAQNKLYKDIIDENIPADLLKAYKQSSVYPSQKRPGDSHREITDNNYARRTMKYDYGKANYDPISAEEAFRMVKADNNQVENLRVIFNGELVEYEVRNNGSIYPIYRSPDEVTIDGKVYKNVGYVNWKTILKHADKIYLTDEYSKKLSADAQEKRRQKDIPRYLYKGKVLHDSDYDPHRPHQNFISGERIIRKAIPDTGDHGRYGVKKEAYLEYDLARKALKKLEREKNTYTDAEYDELRSQLEQNKQTALNKYENTVKTLRAIADRDIKEIPARVADFNNKIFDYTKAVEDALARSHSLKTTLDKLLTQTANTGDLYGIQRLRKSLLNTIQAMLKDKYVLNNAADTIDDKTKTGILSSLNDLIRYKEEYIQGHLSQIELIQNRLKEVESELARYRPNVAAKKARNLAANTKELDKELADIIDFTNF